MSRKGVNQHIDDISVCMVIGCGRKAIYRNATSNRVKGSQRGYCSKHKSLAVESAATIKSVADYYAHGTDGRRR